jgi:hypothetical protein
MTVLEKLKEFIDEGKDSGYVPPKWIDDDDMKVYVRKGRHLLKPGGKMQVCLDIASVEVDEDKRGKGIFSNFLEKAHEMNPWDATYVECVHNQDLAVFLMKSGWMMVEGSFPQSFFLMKDWNNFFEVPGLTRKKFDLQ